MILTGGAMALSDGLELPSVQMVDPNGNSLVTSLACHRELEDATTLLARWLRRGSVERRLEELRTAYYAQFLRPGRRVPLYLHQWYPERSPGEFLREWEGFLASGGLFRAPGWREGIDHLSVAMECASLLSSRRDSMLDKLCGDYLLPGFRSFSETLRAESQSDFYTALALVCLEVLDELEGGRLRDSPPITGCLV